jgi:hypothetical protein
MSFDKDGFETVDDTVHFLELFPLFLWKGMYMINEYQRGTIVRAGDRNKG